MPIFKNRFTLTLSERMYAFLRFEAGAGRTVPEDPDHRAVRLSEEVRRLKASNTSLQTSLDKSRESNAKLQSLQKAQKKTEVAPKPRPTFVDAPGGRLPLPPNDARPCGDNHTDDAYYIKSADDEALRLSEKLGIEAGSSLLDLGCGPGRVAIGLTRKFRGDLTYRGLDVNARWVGWAKENLTVASPNLRFSHLDVKSERYNSSGAELAGDFAFPISDGYYDFACLFSVFTHMMPDDVRVYLGELHRVLKPGGRMVFTAFLEDGVAEVEENPPGYLGRNWSGPLHCVRYERSYMYRLAEESGFEILKEDPDQNFQRHVYVTKP